MQYIKRWYEKQGPTQVASLTAVWAQKLVYQLSHSLSFPTGESSLPRGEINKWPKSNCIFMHFQSVFWHVWRYEIFHQNLFVALKLGIYEDLMVVSRRGTFMLFMFQDNLAGFSGTVVGKW